MSLFDRFTSKKGKQSGVKPKSGKVTADEAQDKTFASVPAATDTKAVKKDDQKTQKEAAGAKSVVKESTDRAHAILRSPVVTEKSTRVNQNSQYIFMINAGVTKVDVRQAVHHVYGIRPVAVNIVNLPGKWVRYGRSVGRTIKRKKAIVTLPAGKTIDTTK